MEETLTLEKTFTLLGIFTGVGLLVWLVIHFVRKDNRSLPEKLVDRAKAVVDR